MASFRVASEKNPVKFIGQVGTSFAPGIGQVADIRNRSAAFNAVAALG